MANKIIIIYTTVASLPEAEKIAEQVITDKLAACVNVVPNALSMYEWQGKFTKTAECLMILKTSISKGNLLYKWLLNNHPYQVPAILKTKVDASKEFNKYVTTQT